MKSTLVPLVSLLALAACGRQTVQPATGATPPGYQTFTSARYGIRISYPADLELRHTFKRSYLAVGGWKTYMGLDAPPGQPLAALVMPGSNHITDGELRIGVSRDPMALETCTDLPAAGRPATQQQVTIDGVPFTTFKAADAGMSHYLIVRSFRAVHRGTCYALDVLVFGTNPLVYDPPATPPFTKAAVFARLVPVVRRLQFIAPSESAATAFPAPLPATYKGLLPCADCPGIDYQLNLRADHRYALRLDYRDRASHFDQHGRWRLSADGDTLILKDRKGAPRQWAVLENGRRLRLLNAGGQPIRSGLNYELTRQARFEPLGR